MTPDAKTGYGQYNAGDYSNPEVDRLTLETQTMADRKARAEVLKCAKGMRFYAAHAEEFLAPETLADPSAVNASRAGSRYLARCTRPGATSCATSPSGSARSPGASSASRASGTHWSRIGHDGSRSSQSDR